MLLVAVLVCMCGELVCVCALAHTWPGYVGALLCIFCARMLSHSGMRVVRRHGFEQAMRARAYGAELVRGFWFVGSIGALSIFRLDLCVMRMPFFSVAFVHGLHITVPDLSEELRFETDFMKTTNRIHICCCFAAVFFNAKRHIFLRRVPRFYLLGNCAK